MEHLFKKIEQEAQSIVWYSPSQIDRGDDTSGDPSKGERPWIIPRTTGEFLYAKILEYKPKIVLELGTSIGYSTLWIASAIHTYGGHVHTIEMKDKKLAYAKQYAHEANLESSITFHEGKIADVLPNLVPTIEIDFVFMDADRGHYHEYFPLIEKHLSNHSIIIADNAGNMQNRMMPFLKLLEDKRWDYKILDLDNGILIATYPAVRHSN